MSLAESVVSRREQMFGMIRRYLSSDQTQGRFCQSEQISKSTFTYWLRRYRQDQAGSNEPVFRPIPIPVSPSALRCEIEFSSGLTLRIYA
jgi:transposase-like protein